MDAEQLIDAITPEAYERLFCMLLKQVNGLKGTPLSQQQRDSCMQAVMLYQSKHNSEAQHMTVAKGGEVSFKSKSELKKQFADDQDDILRVNPNQA